MTKTSMGPGGRTLLLAAAFALGASGPAFAYGTVAGSEKAGAAFAKSGALHLADKGTKGDNDGKGGKGGKGGGNAKGGKGGNGNKGGKGGNGGPSGDGGGGGEGGGAESNVIINQNNTEDNDATAQDDARAKIKDTQENFAEAKVKTVGGAGGDGGPSNGGPGGAGGGGGSGGPGGPGGGNDPEA